MAQKKRYSYDYDKARKYLEKLNASIDSIYSWWKPEQGDNIIRILPPISETADVPYEEVFLHYGLDDVPVTCLGSKCPICNFIKQSGRSKQFKQIRKARRLFFQIIDRDMEVPEPMVWSAGSGFLQYFLPVFLDIDEYGDVTDPDEGTDFVISRKGTGMKTKYTYRIKRNSSPLSEDKDETKEILEDLVDLSTISKRLSVDEVDDLLQDYLSDKDLDDDPFDDDDESPRRKRKRKPRKKVDKEEEEEEERPKSTRKKSSGSKSTSKEKTSRTTRSTKTENEDEGEDKEEPDEDEVESEEDETPKRKPHKKKQVDKEEEEEEGEEEDEKPMPKKKAKSKSSSSNDSMLNSLLEELDGELADVDDEDDE